MDIVAPIFQTPDPSIIPIVLISSGENVKIVELCRVQNEIQTVRLFVFIIGLTQLQHAVYISHLTLRSDILP